MHELGVVFYVIKDVKKIAQENNISKVRSVTLAIGQVSTVIPELLDDCWKWAVKREPVMAEAELIVETIPAITHCEDCGTDYDTVAHAKICPNCGSENTYLIQGNEFTIKEITVEDEGVDAEVEAPEDDHDAVDSGMHFED